MKKAKLKLFMAIVLVLLLAVAVVAVMQSGSQLVAAAGQQEVKDTRTKDLALDALASAKVKKAKPASPKKPSAKPGETAAEPAAVAASAEQKHQELAALIDQAERERGAAKKVAEPTKSSILKLKDELVGYYRAKAEDSAVAAEPERVAFYEAAAKKIEAVALTATKDAVLPADVETIGRTSAPETRAFNTVLKKTEKSSVSADQKNFLYDHVAMPLLRSLNIFLSLFNTAQSLAQQSQSPSPGAAGAGCSTTARTAPAPASADLGLLQALLGLFQNTIQGYRETLFALQDLTGRAISVPALQQPKPAQAALVMPTAESIAKEREADKTSEEKQVDFLKKLSPNPGSGGSPGGSAGGSSGSSGG